MTEVWFVLGYLGSGKTTFVKNFLAQHPGRNAVLVNDFGAEDVDGVLLERSAVKIKSIFNGSVFCSCRSELFVQAMLDLAGEKFDRILVETSGLSNPFQMRKMFAYINDRCRNAYRFAGAVCIVDARNLEKILYTLNAVKMQIAAADVILINKTDLVQEADRARLENTVRALNADAPLYFTENARLPDENFPVKEHALPALIEDITVQKLKIEFGDVVATSELLHLSADFAEFCHRIKGVIRKENGQCAVYEYVDGAARLFETEKDGNFLILLAAGKFSLRERALGVLEKTEIQFTLC